MPYRFEIFTESGDLISPFIRLNADELRITDGAHKFIRGGDVIASFPSEKIRWARVIGNIDDSYDLDWATDFMSQHDRDVEKAAKEKQNRGTEE